MISFFETEIKSLSIHHVGNKTFDEYYTLSEYPTPIDDFTGSLLKSYLLNPFTKLNEVFKFQDSNVTVRPTCAVMFDKPANDFHEITKVIATHLFDVADHPKVKSGELYVAQFTNVQYKGELLDAIGIFKVETKESFFQLSPSTTGFDVYLKENGVRAIGGVDKGCLIFNIESGDGYRVLCFDNSKQNAAKYWKDEFLNLQVVNEEYNITTNTLQVVKNFIVEKLDEEFEVAPTDKVDLLNKSLKYFKEKESFDVDEFCHEVIGNKEASAKFKSYRSIYGEEFDELPDSFNISTPAVKKQSSAFKKVIKLDKNFHIYVHGNKELIQNGYDEEVGMNFYKVFYKEEA